VEATQQTAQANGGGPTPPPPAKELFRFSSWLHVGPGAENCEDVDEEKGTCACGNPLHFHAWCRLPNQFQHREIRDKAMAARARRARQLRDPESDSWAVLEAELDELRRLGEQAAKPGIVDELVQRDWWRDYLEAVKDVDEMEDDKGEKRFAHIEEDRRRFNELSNKPADERPTEEFDELASHLAAYEEQIRLKTEEAQRPRREGFEQREFEDLLGLIRDQRIDSEVTEVFTHIYSTHQWLAGTLTEVRGRPRFASIDELQTAAPEVVDALQNTFGELERTFQQGETGN
jgi:hypothetical protein